MTVWFQGNPEGTKTTILLGSPKERRSHMGVSSFEGTTSFLVFKGKRKESHHFGSERQTRDCDWKIRKIRSP